MLGGDPRRRAAPPDRDDHRDLRRVRPDRVRGRPDARRLARRRARLAARRRCSGVSAALSVAAAALVWFGSTRGPAGGRARRAGSCRSRTARCGASCGDPVVRRIFAIYGVAFLANQMSRPYQPLIVEAIVGTGRRPRLVDRLRRRNGGARRRGDRAAGRGRRRSDRFPAGAPRVAVHRRVRAACRAADPRDPAPGRWRSSLFTAANGLVGAMVFSLLATEVPPERRSPDAQPRLPAAVRGGDRRAAGRWDRRRPSPARRVPFWVGAAVFLVGRRRGRAARPAATCGRIRRPGRAGRSRLAPLKNALAARSHGSARSGRRNWRESPPQWPEGHSARGGARPWPCNARPPPDPRSPFTSSSRRPTAVWSTTSRP